MARLKKVVVEGEGKISVLNVEVTRLEAIKEEVETELESNFDRTLELLKQSFL